MSAPAASSTTGTSCRMAFGPIRAPFGTSIPVMAPYSAGSIIC
jgi:hypothetical protein